MKYLFTSLLMVEAAAAAPRFLEELSTQRLQAFDTSKPVVMTFIQPRCGPCKLQLQELKCVHAQLGSEVGIYAVQVAGDSVELERSLKPLHLGFPVFRASAEFLAEYGADRSGTPMTVVLAKGGKLKERVLGPQHCKNWVRTIKELQP